MRAVRLAFAVLLAACAGVVHAEPGQIAFAVPEDGRITLGVFDSNGRLVRQLHALAPQSDFTTGLNGLITKWDGRDDAGTTVAPGTYHIRGYLIGDVEVEGRSFHFNDWITSGTDPRLTEIKGFALLENGDVALAGREPGGAGFVARYSPEDGFVWTRPVDTEPSLAADASNVFLLSNATLDVLQVTDGAPAAPSVPLAGSRIAASGGRLFSLQGRGVHAFNWPGLQPVGTVDFPDEVTDFDAGGNATVAASGGMLFFAKAKEGIRRLEIPAVARSISLGMGESVWFVTDEPDALVGQVSPTGELLRTLRPENGEPLPVAVRASQSAERFAVLDAAPGLQRFRVLERSDDGTWQIDWERTITSAPTFGFSGGNVTASSRPEISSHFPVRLDPDPLTNHRPVLELRCVFDESGVRIVTLDGLLVAPISDSPDTTQFVATRGDAPDSLRILRGNGAVVEEFAVSGLRKITPLDAGDVERP